MYRLIVFIAFAASIAWMAVDPSFEPFVVILLTIAAVFRDEIHGVVGSKILSLTPRGALARDLSNARYSFTQEELVNPMILADLYGWISDLGEQIVSIDIAGANTSNRYHFDQITVREATPNPVVTAQREEASFSYQYLGRSYTGIHLLRVWDYGGGSGVFCAIMLVTLSSENAINIMPGEINRTKRFIIKKLSSVPLGDRYEGEVSYRFGLLSIGPCKGRATLRSSKQRLMVL